MASCRPTRAWPCTRRASTAAAAVPGAPLLEVGSYCGKSSVYLGAAAQAGGHGARRDRPPPWLRGEPAGLGVARARPRRPRSSGVMDTLPWFRRTVFEAGLEDVVVALVGRFADGRRGIWSTPCALVFIDGGHGEEPAAADFRSCGPPTSRRMATSRSTTCSRIRPTAGRPPYERIYLPAIELGAVHRGHRRPDRSGSSAGRLSSRLTGDARSGRLRPVRRGRQALAAGARVQRAGVLRVSAAVAVACARATSPGRDQRPLSSARAGASCTRPARRCRRSRRAPGRRARPAASRRDRPGWSDRRPGWAW